MRFIVLIIVHFGFDGVLEQATKYTMQSVYFRIVGWLLFGVFLILRRD